MTMQQKNSPSGAEKPKPIEPEIDKALIKGRVTDEFKAEFNELPPREKIPVLRILSGYLKLPKNADRIVNSLSELPIPPPVPSSAELNEAREDVIRVTFKAKPGLVVKMGRSAYAAYQATRNAPALRKAMAMEIFGVVERDPKAIITEFTGGSAAGEVGAKRSVPEREQTTVLRAVTNIKPKMDRNVPPVSNETVSDTSAVVARSPSSDDDYEPTVQQDFTPQEQAALDAALEAFKKKEGK